MTEPLTLTQEQIGKIAGMTSVFFKGETVTITGKNADVTIQVGDSKVFHWFEFCFTILAEKIIQYNHEKMGDLAYTTIMIKTIHPVDFLWDIYFNKQ